EQYRGVAEFFAFIAKPETQKRWHEHTGYLPLGLKGIYAGILQSSRQPVLRLAQKDLEDAVLRVPMKRVGPQNQIRGVNDEVLEGLFSDLMTPSEALHESVTRANHILLRFARNTD
ncbi:MAG: glycerol-3-phosphate ABC transporter substrate-binding protein, partial [Legionellales bacterium]